MRRQDLGFTLIELLVVIAIIAILAAILFPVFVSVQDKGKQTRCFNNEKQLIGAFLMYAQDNGGRSPMGVWSGQCVLGWNWSISIEKYVKNAGLGVWRCPSIPKPNPPAADYITYGANGEITGDYDNSENRGYRLAPWPPKALDCVKSPTRVVLIYEDPQSCPRRYGRPQYAASVDYILGYSSYYDMWNFFKTHMGGSNYAFVDGHVKWLKYGAVGGNLGPNSGKSGWFTLLY